MRNARINITVYSCTHVCFYIYLMDCMWCTVSVLNLNDGCGARVHRTSIKHTLGHTHLTRIHHFNLVSVVCCLLSIVCCTTNIESTFLSFHNTYFSCSSHSAAHLCIQTIIAFEELFPFFPLFPQAFRSFSSDMSASSVRIHNCSPATAMMIMQPVFTTHQAQLDGNPL